MDVECLSLNLAVTPDIGQRTYLYLVAARVRSGAFKFSAGDLSSFTDHETVVASQDRLQIHSIARDDRQDDSNV